MSILRPLHILVADDHDLMRRGLKLILQARPGWEICAEARTGTDAVRIAQALKPDIAILDISMPELDGLGAAKEIRKVSPATAVLVLSMHYSDQLIRETIEAGARGFVLKSDSDRDLVAAVEALANRRPFFTASATELMLDTPGGSIVRHLAGKDVLKDRLTVRELEVVRLLAQDHSSIEAAKILEISVKTVDTHRANVMRKLKCHNVTELVRYALRNKIIEA